MSRIGTYDDTHGFVPDDDAPQKFCINCKSHCVWAGKDGEPEHKKCLVGYTPITNADRIRSMSDEELAKWIAFETEGIGFDSFEEFEKGWLEWLKEEVEDEHID